jgi:hypothetical protein
MKAGKAAYLDIPHDLRERTSRKRAFHEINTIQGRVLTGKIGLAYDWVTPLKNGT